MEEVAALEASETLEGQEEEVSAARGDLEVVEDVGDVEGEEVLVDGEVLEAATMDSVPVAAAACAMATRRTIATSKTCSTTAPSVGRVAALARAAYRPVWLVPVVRSEGEACLLA